MGPDWLIYELRVVHVSDSDLCISCLCVCCLQMEVGEDAKQYVTV